MALTSDPADGEHPAAGGVHRFDRFWQRHRRTFWILHSVWALATGGVVLWLAHERYHFVYWVVGFLALTWASTLYFGRSEVGENDGFSKRMGRGLASYLTRVMYQDTLFFLIPFYAYSAVVPSWNLVFLGLLCALAVLACLDLVFDRWLRESPVFSLVFFASVAFGGMNLLFPMLFAVDPSVATALAAVGALATAVPIVARQPALERRDALHLGLAAVVMLAIAGWARPLIPPVPLRLQEITFASGFDREALEPREEIHGDVTSGSLGGTLFTLARVFAPSNVPARVTLEWWRDGELLRRSREVEIVAHEGGFRVWDGLRSDDPDLDPGVYRVVLRTADGRVFGDAAITLHPAPSHPDG